MLPDQSLLFGVLLQESLGDNESDVIASDPDLLEAILHAPQRVGHKLEARIVEKALLDACNKPEPWSFADLDLSFLRELGELLDYLRSRTDQALSLV